jgi:hypothetical protein
MSHSALGASVEYSTMVLGPEKHGNKNLPTTGTDFME